MRTTILTLAALVFSFGALAQQPRTPVYDESNEAYKAGFKEGYSKGYREGLNEGERRGATTVVVPVAPPPPKAGPTGPITISSASYGDGSKNCNATHWVARRANGKMSVSLDVENSICGDPAPGKRKSLDVYYICGTFAKTANGFEHRSIYLDCSP